MRQLLVFAGCLIAFSAVGCDCGGGPVADAGLRDTPSTLDTPPADDVPALEDAPDAAMTDDVPPDAPVIPVCGNDMVEAPEVCDDGNTMEGDGCSADCTSDESCGNTIVDTATGEVCDDGDTTNGGACRGDCLSDYSCGNGITDLVADGAAADETCDDGGTDGGDGCSADCLSDETCGNAIVDTAAGEVCDDGNTVGGDTCSADCQMNLLCGNGMMDGSEQCDDGAHVPGDGCSADCLLEECGNAILDPGEACDDGDPEDDDGCRTTCEFTCTDDADCDDGLLCNGTETCAMGGSTDSRCSAGTAEMNGVVCGPADVCVGGTCTASMCGDGLIDTRTEQCDDMNATPDDGCESDCSFTCENGADCSDGDPCNGAEICDQTDPLAPVCADGPDLTCTPSDTCHSAACTPGMGCGETLIDMDMDGHAPLALGACGTDCDDSSAMVNPGIAEMCNGVDDNCSGVADEGNPGAGGTCTTPMPGVCAAGTFVCSAGSLMCVRTTEPSAEVCDGRDNNCSGVADEGNPGGGATCPSGAPGVCGPGTTQCVGGALTCFSNIAPGSVPETCNNLDDNCNGMTDDGSAAVLCPPPPSVATTSCNIGGVCAIAGCATNQYNVDGTYSNGCECTDVVVNSCVAPTTLGNIAVGASVTAPAATVPVVGGGDFYVVSFTPSGRGPAQGTPTIEFAPGSGASFRFDVLSSCGGAALSCGSGGTATGLQSWSFTDNASVGYTSHFNTWPSSVIVRVYSTSATPTCASYQLRVRRP